MSGLEKAKGVSPSVFTTVKEYSYNRDAFNEPLPILLPYFVPRFQEELRKFTQLRSSHDNFLVIPDNSERSQDWKREKVSIARFIDVSIAELDGIIKNLLAYTRSPISLMHRLLRIQNEYRYIHSERTSLNTDIASHVRNAKKSTRTEPQPHQASALIS